MTKLICTVEPIVWVLRLAQPDGTDHPPFTAVATAMKSSERDVILKGAHGIVGKEGMSATWRALKSLGFERVCMDRHGHEAQYRLDDLLKHGVRK